MTNRMRNPLLAGLAALLAPASPAAASDVDALKAATVRITAKHGDGQEVGAGVILCQRRRQVYVLTAKHVVSGEGAVDEYGAPSRRFVADSIEVKFFRNDPPPVQGTPEAFYVEKAASKDLALLQLVDVDVPLTPARVGSAEAVQTRDETESVGHSAVVGSDWLPIFGKVNEVGEFIHHSSAVEPGYSGGPLFNRAGELVGINTQKVGSVARAIPIDEALRTFRSAMDPECLRMGVAPPTTAPEPGKRWIERAADLNMAFRYVPAGTFLMGSPEDEQGRYPNETVHQVELTRGFWIGETEVTQAQWQRLMENNPSFFTGCGENCPVERVNWYEAATYANRLSEEAGKERCYEIGGCEGTLGGGCDGGEMGCLGDYNCATVDFQGLDCAGYRLPTEAEWEYAARAGTRTALYTGSLTILGVHHGPELDEIAWYGGNSGVAYAGGYDCSAWPGKQHPSQRCGTHPVGWKGANGWGLYDVLGNVWEWAWDWAGDYRTDSDRDPLGRSRGSNRVIRGGSWRYNARCCRAACRNSDAPGDRAGGVGFRLVRTSE